MRPDHVLIAGGGIAGLAAASALRRRGIASRVLERRGDPADAGLAVNLPGNAIRALAALGCGDALHGLGSPIRRREYRTAQDRLLFAVDEAAFWGADALPRCLRRADLLRLLQRGVPDGSVRQGAAVNTVRQDEDDVTVVLANGDVEHGGFLVGADGVHSAVRREVFGAQAPAAAVLASASWRFMMPDPGIDCWTVWAGFGGLFLLIPTDRGEAYGWVSASGVSTAGDDLAALWPIFERFPGVVRESLASVLSRPGSIYHSPLEEVRLPSWHSGRVVLTGDAAHATAPVFAQGAASALEDALVLADVLAEGADRRGVGADYEKRRRPRCLN